jgi:CBS domain-containing protein
MRISVGELMSEKVVTVEVETPLANVAKIMRRKNVGCVVVCEKGRPVGVITEWDIMRKVVEKNLDPSKFLARDVMSTPLISVTRGTDVMDALRLMAKRKIRRLPVVERNRLFGIVTLVDLFSVAQERKEMAAKIEEIVGRK